MLRHCLLILGILLSLSGCSRCEREEPKPAPIPFDVRIFTWTRVHFEGDSIVWTPVMDTGPQFVPPTYGLNFEPTDTTWDEYVWRFHKLRRRDGQLDYAKRLNIRDAYFGVDTVFLTAYRNKRQDSATARKTFEIIHYSQIGLEGAYRGRLEYGDQVFEDVTIDIAQQYEGPPYRDCLSTRNGYAIKGLFKPCGSLDMDIPIAYPQSLLAFQLGPNVINLNADSVDFSTLTSCGFTAETRPCDIWATSPSGHSNSYGELDKQGALKLLFPSFRNGAQHPNITFTRIYFTGQKL